MFPFLFGFSIMHFIENIMKNAMKEKSSFLTASKWVDFKFDNECFEVIKLTELAGKKVHSKAYFDNQWTIGFGTSSIYDLNGNFLRMVKPTDTLSSLKSMFKMSNYSDYDFAKQLVFNYSNNSKKYPVIAKILDATNVPFDKNVAVALFDASYNSGGIFQNVKRNQDFANEMKLAGNDLRKKAIAYIRFRSTYVKNAVSANNYRLFSRGWFIRWYWISQYIEKIRHNYSGLQSTYKTVALIRGEIFAKYSILV